MSDIRKILNIINETTSSGAVATGPATNLFMNKRTDEYAAEDSNSESEAPKVLEYGNWENSALTTSNKLKKTRKKAAKTVKSIYDESLDGVAPSTKMFTSEGATKTRNPVAKAAQRVAKGSGKHKNPAKTIPRKQKYKSVYEEENLSEMDLIVSPASKSKLDRALISKDRAHHDHEVEMARGDLYQAAKNAAEVLKLIKDRSEMEGLEGWVQEKIVKASDYLNTIREYLQNKSVQHRLQQSDSMELEEDAGEQTYPPAPDWLKEILAQPEFQIAENIAEQDVAESSSENTGEPKSREELYQYHLEASKISKGRAKEHHLQQAKKYKKQGVAEGSDKDTLTQAVNLYREFSKKYPHKIAVDKSAKAHDLDPNKLNNYIDHGKYHSTAKSEQGVTEGSEKHKQSRLWAMISDYEQRAKATKNDIKKQHYMKMADELRGKLKTSDDQEVTEARLGESKYWRVEQSEATGRYYIVKGYQKRTIWSNKSGASDFNSKAAAEKKAAELNQKEGLTEGVGKDLAMLGGATAVALGAGIAASQLDRESKSVTTVDGKEYIQHELPNQMDKVKLTTDDKGNKVYIWVERRGMKPAFTYYWYAPVEKQAKESIEEGLSDVVKGIKRKIAGKTDPKEVEHTYGRIARRDIEDANKLNNQAAYDARDKSTKRWEKVNKVVNKEGVAEGAIQNDSRSVTINEFDYSSELGELALTNQQIMSNSTIDGKIGSRSVHLFKQGANRIYFFESNNKIDALVYLHGDRLFGMKNYSSNKGLNYNLFQYIINIKRQKVRLSPIDKLTHNGLNWIISQIQRPTGFKITDGNGNPVTASDVFNEWETARTTGKHGPTELIISQSSNASQIRANESRLMPMDIWGATLSESAKNTPDISELYESFNLKSSVAEAKTPEEFIDQLKSLDTKQPRVTSICKKCGKKWQLQHHCKSDSDKNKDDKR